MRFIGIFFRYHSRLTSTRSYSSWAVHRSTIIFGPDANVYRPERWLDASEAQLQRMERNNELIFGYGRFKCLGQIVALMELNKVFVEVRRLFPSQEEPVTAKSKSC